MSVRKPQSKCIKIQLKLRKVRFYPISGHCLHFILLENAKNPKYFLVFSEGVKGNIARYGLSLQALVKYLEYFNLNPANIYFFKVNNRNTWKRCNICSKLSIKTRQYDNKSDVNDVFLVFLLLI